MLNLNRHIRYTLTRFRFGVSDIKVHKSRFKVYNVDDLKCPLCLSAVDNEVHFVLCCPAFDDLRYEFIEPKYFNNPCEFRLALLLATQNERALKNLALFVYKAFSRRKTLLFYTPQKAIRHREEVILCCGCVRPDRYDVSYELPYRGYVPGETMFPDVRMRNFTRHPITVSVRLQMVSENVYMLCVRVRACVRACVRVCVCVCVCVPLRM